MQQTVALPDSAREPMAGAASAGPADAGQHLEVSVLIKRRGESAFAARLSRLHRAGPDRPAHLTREEYAQQHGAEPGQCAAIRAFAQSHGLSVAREHGARRTMVLSGTVAQFNAAFAIELQRYRYPGGFYRGFSGPLHVPPQLLDIVEAVLGLDDRPQAGTHFRVRRPNAAPSSYTPLQIASLYGFPAGDGSGQTIALIELGGGFVASDLSAYFSGLGLGAQPTVLAVGVDGASNAPTGDPNGPDGEVMLDIEVAGALAPAARIAVYFGPNTDAGFLDAITTAIHDTTNKPSVISISWGGPEASWSQQALNAFDQAFQDAAALGITVCAAAGDNGSSDGLAGDHVDFPASSPHAIACGGTRLQASGTSIASETVWNDGPGAGATGGGVSAAFALPAWQQGLAVAKTAGGATALQARGVPDVAADADPQTGYQVRADGQDEVFGGTSAVAPLWAGLIARINAQKGAAVGFVNPLLYSNGAAFNDITQGNNGDFAAAPGWDACTGLGSPKGAALSKALGG